VTATSPIARLLLPALRADAGGGFEGARGEIDDALDLGVGGFILFGGSAERVAALTAELRERAPHPLLLAADLERGAGQQFRGATPLPPAAALGSLGDLEATERAGELTAREARALGVNWVYAPVADVDLEPANPIIGTRAFGVASGDVARHVDAWVRGCARGGALSCAKHFPGHGRTVADSHAERPVVTADRAALDADLAPFRAAIAAGVDALMTAHVVYPALDPAGSPATLSAPILTRLLREEMGFDGLVVTDALIMDGLIADATEGDAAVAALVAGCDALLYPEDLAGVVASVEAGVRDGRLAAGRIDEALRRVEAAAARATAHAPTALAGDDDRRWALELAVRTVHAVRGTPRLPEGPLHVVEVEDDLGGPWPPFPRDALPAALRAAGRELDADGAALVVVYSDIRAWKGRPGLSAGAVARVAEALAAEPDATVLLFAHPRLAPQLPAARHLLAAWGGEPLMQQASVAWLTGARGGMATVGTAGIDR
jgi:beta-glucosidase-like glycosyl hydrolase